MTKQELYVINSLTGKPAELVANIMAILPVLMPFAVLARSSESVPSI